MLHFAPSLQVRSKWFKSRDNLAVGDVVLVIDPNVSRSKWNLAVVDDAYAGPDGLVRSVRIRTAFGIYDRPISKLSLLLAKLEIYQ